MTLAGDDPLSERWRCGAGERKRGAGEKYADKKIRPEGVWQTRAVESRLVPRFLDGEIDGKDRSLVGAYISREGGYDDRREGRRESQERENKKKKKRRRRRRGRRGEKGDPKSRGL